MAITKTKNDLETQTDERLAGFVFEDYDNAGLAVSETEDEEFEDSVETIEQSDVKKKRTNSAAELSPIGQNTDQKKGKTTN